MIAARVMRIMCATTTRVNVAAGSMERYSLSPKDNSVLILEIPGIEIEVIREPNDGYWKNVWMKKPWGACYWGGRPTEDWMFTTAYMGGADWNDTFWKHDRFDKLLIWARAETNQAKRREMYYAMQEIVRDEGGVVIPMFANYVLAMTDKVKHGTLAGNWDMDGQKFMERWWFA